MLGGAVGEGVVRPFVVKLVTGALGAPVLDLATEEFVHVLGGKLLQNPVEEDAHTTCQTR